MNKKMNNQEAVAVQHSIKLSGSVIFKKNCFEMFSGKYRPSLGLLTTKFHQVEYILWDYTLGLY